jgi:hypothetical protein
MKAVRFATFLLLAAVFVRGVFAEGLSSPGLGTAIRLHGTNRVGTIILGDSDFRFNGTSIEIVGAGGEVDPKFAIASNKYLFAAGPQRPLNMRRQSITNLGSEIQIYNTNTAQSVKLRLQGTDLYIDDDPIFTEHTDGPGSGMNSQFLQGLEPEDFLQSNGGQNWTGDQPASGKSLLDLRRLELDHPISVNNYHIEVPSGGGSEQGPIIWYDPDGPKNNHLILYGGVDNWIGTGVRFTNMYQMYFSSTGLIDAVQATMAVSNVTAQVVQGHNNTDLFVKTLSTDSNIVFQRNIVLPAKDTPTLQKINRVGEMIFDGNDNALVIGDSVKLPRHIPTVQAITYTLSEPDLKQALSDFWVIKAFPLSDYPHGATLDSIIVTTSTICDDIITFESWRPTVPTAWQFIQNHQTMSLLNNVFTTTKTFSDGTISGGDYLAVDLDATPCDVAWMRFDIFYHINGS